MENMNLTALEQNILTAFIGQLDAAEPGYSCVDAHDLVSNEIGIKQVRGILGSLQKKGIVTIHETHDGYRIIYLNKQYWGLIK